MTSHIGTDPDLPTVCVSGGFLWRATEAGVFCSAEVAAENAEPFEQEWARRLDPLSVRAVWCVGEARRAAGLVAPSTRPNREGVCLSTGMGALQTRLRYASRLVSHGLSGTNPIDFPDSIDGAPAAHVALKWNLQGPSFTVLGADGPHHALVIAARQLVLETADRMHVVIGDVFEPRLRNAPNNGLAGQPSPRGRGDEVFALVLERSHVPTSSQDGILLVGFMERRSDESPGNGQLVAHTGAVDGKREDRDLPGHGSIVEAWLGLTAPVGSGTIACQDAAMLERRHCCPIGNPQWPRLAFVRAEKR